MTSDVPMLLLSGVHDFRAPRDWARRAAVGLPKGFLLEVPSGHGAVFNQYAAGALAAFLSHPDRRPELACQE